MICPYCGHVDSENTTPKLTTKGTTKRLGSCSECDKVVWAYPTNKSSEPSPIATVLEGERREVALADAYLDYAGGATHEDRGQAADIDREVFDSEGNLLYFLEIKERSCSLNGYRKTKFPYAKINAGIELTKEYDAPVHIVLKFVDCWAREIIDPESEYEQGDDPFFPGYRPSQANSDRQVPVKISVEELDILGLREGCDELDGSRR
jgi:hypothetical protein